MDLPRAARDVAAAVADLERLGSEVDWDAHRHVSGKRAMGELEAESASPLRDVLVSWVACLTVARVSQPAAMRVSKSRNETLATVKLERDERVDFRAAKIGLLSARSIGEARAYFEAFADFGAPLEEPERTLRAVRTEAFHRLGIEDVATRFLGVSSSDLASHARQFLAQTRDLALSIVHDHAKKQADPWPFEIDLRLARTATEGWPSRLGWRTCAELLPGFIARGVITTDPPRALGASSFARALRRIGETFHASSSLLPPLSPDALRMGDVFASALSEKTFHARVLGLASGRAADQARLVGIAFLLDARFAAMRVALRTNEFESTTALALGAPLPKSLEGVWPPRRDDDFARFVSTLTLLPRIDALRAREGHDWFRNPRAFATLRDLAVTPLEIEKDAVAALARRFEEALA